MVWFYYGAPIWLRLIAAAWNLLVLWITVWIFRWTFRYLRQRHSPFTAACLAVPIVALGPIVFPIWWLADRVTGPFHRVRQSN